MVKFDAQWALFGEKTHTDIERYTDTDKQTSKGAGRYRYIHSH